MIACPFNVTHIPVTSPDFLPAVAQATAYLEELWAGEMDFLLQCFNLTLSLP